MNRLHHLRELLLTLGAVLGVLCMLSLVATVALDVKPLVVLSGSMSPELGTGALALSREVPATEVQVGDVVSVKAASGVRVTHRVASIAEAGDRQSLILKGDANSTPDRAPYLVSHVDRVFFDVPSLGYAVVWLARPVGRSAVGALVAVLLIVGFATGEARPPRGRHFAGTAAAVLAVGLVGLGGLDRGRTESTLAAYNDTGTATAGQFAAYTVPAPLITSCAVTGNSHSGFTATITWSAVTTPHAISYSARIVQSNTALTVNISGATRNVKVMTTGLLGSLLGTTITVEVLGFPTVAPTWKSAPTNQNLTVGLLGLSLSCV